MSNFMQSLNRNRKEFSEARAIQLASDASEAKYDLTRDINKKIRDIENHLTAIENDAYEDDIIVAFKKGRAINVADDVVKPRYQALMDLKDLYDERSIMQRDIYFNVPEELKKIEKGKYEDLVSDADLAAAGEHPVED